VLFAYQAMAGTLVHAVLNNPGPLKLEDEALKRELIRMIRAYLIDGSSSARPKGSPPS
jgi:hypothetical protein